MDTTPATAAIAQAWTALPDLGWPTLVVVSLILTAAAVAWAVVDRNTLRALLILTVTATFTAGALVDQLSDQAEADTAEQTLELAIADYLADAHDLVATAPLMRTDDALTLQAVDHDGQTHQVTVRRMDPDTVPLDPDAVLPAVAPVTVSVD